MARKDDKWSDIAVTFIMGKIALKWIFLNYVENLKNLKIESFLAVKKQLIMFFRIEGNFTLPSSWSINCEFKNYQWFLALKNYRSSFNKMNLVASLNEPTCINKLGKPWASAAWSDALIYAAWRVLCRCCMHNTSRGVESSSLRRLLVALRLMLLQVCCMNN